MPKTLLPSRGLSPSRASVGVRALLVAGFLVLPQAQGGTTQRNNQQSSTQSNQQNATTPVGKGNAHPAVRDQKPAANATDTRALRGNFNRQSGAGSAGQSGGQSSGQSGGQSGSSGQGGTARGGGTQARGPAADNSEGPRRDFERVSPPDGPRRRGDTDDTNTPIAPRPSPSWFNPNAPAPAPRR